MFSKFESKKWYRIILGIGFSLTTFLIISCGSDYSTGDGVSSAGTGSYSFSLAWPDGTPMNVSSSTVPRAVDCAATEIETITAVFYNNSEQLLNNPPDVFLCTDRKGSVSGLPPGSNYRVLIIGENVSGQVLYQGEETGITIVAGQTTPGSEIPMSEVTVSCTDGDTDTYYPENGCLTAVDCDDSDEYINPGAIEVCDDSSDNDCDGDTDCDDAECNNEIACTSEPTISVPGDYATIQEAIDAATNGDTVLVANGTYTTPDDEGIDFNGKAITVRSQNGPENCIINAGGTGRGFYFHNGEQVNSILSGFTITNGVIDGWSMGGGGILCEGASPIIQNCIIRNNRAEAIAGGGGGICVFLASPTIINCLIDSNHSVDADGGGIYCDNATPIIMNCTIVNNTTIRGSGGGIYTSGPSSITLTNSIFWNNSPGQIDYSPTPPITTYSNIEGGFTGTGNINSDPIFTGAGDYSLGSGSPCIDTGTTSGAPDSDITGATRPQGSGYDMGSYEY